MVAEFGHRLRVLKTRGRSGRKTAFPRQVLKVAALSAALTVARPGAALPDRATRDRAANRLTGD